MKSFCESGKILSFIGIKLACISFFFVEKEIGAKRARRILKILLSRIHVQDISKIDLQTALTTNFSDYEDALQHECAKNCKGIDFIVTRNKKDFKKSIIPIISSEELYIK